MSDIKYFDHAATTRLSSEALEAMMPYLTEDYGNASSIYSIGRTARSAIENSRDTMASILGAKPKEIYFTGGGSESDNIAIKGFAYANKSKGNHIITSKIEHPAVLETCKALEKDGFEVTYLDVDSIGVVDLEQLKKSIKKETILITVMFANNEIGTIEPIGEIGKIAHEHGVAFHTDAVQAFGIIPIDVSELNIDMLSLSAHKFYGPKGTGALYIKTGIKFLPVISGGHQERGKRAGTENTAGIVGMAKAASLAYDNIEKNTEHLEALRNYFMDEVEKRIPHIKKNSNTTCCVPGTANVSFKFIEGESLLLNLDMKGICASSGSACTSGSLDPSHVLLAIGLSHDVAHGSLRVSFGLDNNIEDVKYLLDCLEEITSRLRLMSPLYEDFLAGKYNP